MKCKYCGAVMRTKLLNASKPSEKVRHMICTECGAEVTATQRYGKTEYTDWKEGEANDE